MKRPFLFSLLALSCSFSTFAEAKQPDAPSWKLIQLSNDLSLRGSAIKGQSIWVTGTQNTVFVSQDGGHSWYNKSVDTSLSHDFRDIQLFDENTAIVMGAGSGEQSKLYKTTDGGDSWQPWYENKDPQGFFNSIAFWDKNNGLLMGDPVDGFYVIQKTTDGGKTWRRIAKHKLPRLHVNEAAFAASGNTLIVGKEGQAWLTTGGHTASVYQSNDWGESWQRHSVPIYSKTRYAGGYGLSINANGQPFVVGGDFENRQGPYQNMATLIDGKWQKVETKQKGLKTAMACEHNTCIALGKTNSDISYDNGKTWRAFDVKSPKGFYTLSSDNNTFIAAGADGKVGLLSL